MFSSMFNSLFKKSKKTSKDIPFEVINVAREGAEKLLQEFEKPNVSDSAYNEVCLSQTISINEDDESIDSCSEICNDSISEVSDEENSMPSSSDDHFQSDMQKKLNDLQCPFTWDLKSNKKNIIELIENKYGQYNLDISSSKFTFERFIGNLIISYELFHKGDQEIAQLKILEIGKWLEELDNGNDEFYLSINMGLKHVMMSTFAHMVYATNLLDQTQWLLNDISLFGNIFGKPRAAVHAIKAALSLEYAKNVHNFKKAIGNVKKACDLDPNCSYWFYLHSIILSAERQFLQTYKSRPSVEEKNAIQNAILLSDGCNTKYNFHRMILEKDTVVSDFHANKNDHGMIKMEKNLKDNKMIVNMIKTIMSMKPEDPLIVVKCARTLMTLPPVVRDVQLGKKYLNEALQMAPDDISVIKSVTNAIEVSKKIMKKSGKANKRSIAEINKSSLSEDLHKICEKHRKGENAIPHLTQLLVKCDSTDELKIMSQISSYSILFNNNLRAGVEQFVILMEQKEISYNLIKNHYSSFIYGKKEFNLAELVVNEISLAISSRSTTSADIAYYAAVLVKILDKFKLVRKDADPHMCSNLKLESTAKSVSSSVSYQKESNIKDNRRGRQKNNISKLTDNCARSNTKPQTAQNKNNLSKSNDGNIKKNDHQKRVKSAKGVINKFPSSTASGASCSSFQSNPGPSNHLENLQTQKDFENYARQVYNDIILRSQQNSVGPQNMHLLSDQQRMINNNQTHGMLHGSRNQETPSLLNLRLPQSFSQWRPFKPNNQKKK